MADNAVRRTGSYWPLAVVFLALILVLGIPAAYVAVHTATAPDRFMHSLSLTAADMMRPKISMNEIVLSSVSDLHKENKLVVMTGDIDTDVTIEEGSSSWGMYWGTNVARVAVKDAKVQYVIDTGRMETSDFRFDEQTHVLTVCFPKPHVDSTMVSIDPGRVKTLDLRGGWARFDKESTKDRALAELRPKVVVQANAPYLKEIAEARGIEAATRLLQPMAETLRQEGVTVHVVYRDDAVASAK